MCTLQEGEAATFETKLREGISSIPFYIDIQFPEGVQTPDVYITVSDLELYGSTTAELQLFASPGKQQPHATYGESTAHADTDVEESNPGDVLTLTIGECCLWALAATLWLLLSAAVCCTVLMSARDAC